MNVCVAKRAFCILVLALLLLGCDGAKPTPIQRQPSRPATAEPANATEPRPTATSPATVATATAPAPTPEPSATSTPLPTFTPTPAPTVTPAAVEFAAIGDYGLAGPGEANVATLVSGWQPDFVITLGDNNYPNGEAATIDPNIGQYYAEYIYPYYGTYTTTVPATTTNRFFPSLGNHDYYGPEGISPYLDYFTLPGNERYYDYVWGPVHLFAVNSDFNEPDGVGSDSAQARWLQQQLTASTAPWKIVYMHVPPYSSGNHGSAAWMRWPFGEWGATAVLSGHDHHYERLLVDGTVYFVNGLGGGAIYAVGQPLPGSQVQFTGSHGAMRVEANSQMITFEFVTAAGVLVDSYSLEK